MSRAARQTVVDHFDIRQRAADYHALYARWRELRRPRPKNVPVRYGSRLDQPWLPNAAVHATRAARRWLDDETGVSAVPAVSVLMTAYNREQYIAAAIESVLAQTFADFELIVVDDGSADDTVAAARSYEADPRVRVVVNERNLGDYPNRNRAAGLARGRFLKYHDSDDVMYPHCLATMLPLARRGAPCGLMRCPAPVDGRAVLAPCCSRPGCAISASSWGRKACSCAGPRPRSSAPRCSAGSAASPRQGPPRTISSGSRHARR